MSSLTIVNAYKYTGTLNYVNDCVTDQLQSLRLKGVELQSYMVTFERVDDKTLIAHLVCHKKGD